MGSTERLWRWLRAWAARGASALRRHVRGLALALLGSWTPLRLLAPSPGDTSVDPRWLTAQLHSAGLLRRSATLARVTASDLAGNRGLVGCLTRLRLHYHDRATAAASPGSLVLKMSADDQATRAKIMFSGQAREAVFYRSRWGRQADVASVLPAVLYARGSSRGWGEYVLLMEDLYEDQLSVGVNVILGNQAWGLPPGDLPALPSQLEVLGEIFERTAAYHAAHWRDPALLRERWMKGANWYRGRGRAAWETSVATAQRAWAAAKAQLANRPGLRLDPKLVAVMDRSLAAASWGHLQAHLNDAAVPWTLCHGDFHASNMIWRLGGGGTGTAGPVRMYDWSEVGPWEPTTDLAQMVISDVPVALLAEHSRALVRRYWERLLAASAAIAGGASTSESARRSGAAGPQLVTEDDYPFEQCYEAFCRGGAERWIWLFAVLASFPNLPDAAIQHFHDQLQAFLLHHGHRDTYVVKAVVLLDL